MEWISLKEKLPEVGETVFLGDHNPFTMAEIVSVATRTEYGFVDENTYDLYQTDTYEYWMPIPKLPKGE